MKKRYEKPEITEEQRLELKSCANVMLPYDDPFLPYTGGYKSTDSYAERNYGNGPGVIAAAIAVLIATAGFIARRSSIAGKEVGLGSKTKRHD